jgi:hypothetical protein
MPACLSPVPTLVLAGALTNPHWLGQAAWHDILHAPGWLGLMRRVHPASPSRAVSTDAPIRAAGHEQWAHQTLGLPADHSVAAATAWSDKAHTAHWRMTPVHCHVGRDQIILTPPRLCTLQAIESEALATAILPILSEAGFTLHQAHPQRWYITETPGHQPWNIQTGSLQGALGQPIDHWLPRGPDARRWRRIFNDIQMTWFDHPVNQARAARDEYPINAVWIEGRVPSPCPSGWSEIAHAWLSDLPSPDHSLSTTAALSPSQNSSIDNRLWIAQEQGSTQAWLDAWYTIDRTVFAALGPSADPPYRAGLTLVLGGSHHWRTIRLDPARPTLWQRLRRPNTNTLARLGAAWLGPSASA